MLELSIDLTQYSRAGFIGRDSTPGFEHHMMHETTEPVGEGRGVPRPQLAPFDDESSASGQPPAREGLPPGFRMRADAHYVDQLDTRVGGLPVRLIDTQAVDAGAHDGEQLTAAFIDSVRQLGVLQPLLVSPRNGRYSVVSGRRRLAAAMAAGLRQVPCLVQHVDGDRADQIALASNLPPTRPRAVVPLLQTPSSTTGLSQALAEALTALAACADMIGTGTLHSPRAAADLLKAEAHRAMDLLLALRVLRDEVPLRRTLQPVATILQLVDERTRGEQRSAVRIVIDSHAGLPESTVWGDASLLTEAVSALAVATVSLVEPPVAACARQDSQRVVLTIGASSDASGSVRFVVQQTAVGVPGAWLVRPFEIPWPIRDGLLALSRLQTAKRIAQLHGGDVELERHEDGTRFSLSISSSPARTSSR